MKKHVKGRRGEQFRQKIKELKPGEIRRESFDVDIFQQGYHHLKGEVKRVRTEWHVKKVLWTMEPTGPYHQK